MDNEQHYLGDGLYCKVEKGQVVLFAYNGFQSTDTVYLDHEVLAAFIEWAGTLTRG